MLKVHRFGKMRGRSLSLWPLTNYQWKFIAKFPDRSPKSMIWAISPADFLSSGARCPRAFLHLCLKSPDHYFFGGGVSFGSRSGY